MAWTIRHGHGPRVLGRGRQPWQIDTTLMGRRDGRWVDEAVRHVVRRRRREAWVRWLRGAWR